MKTERQRKSEEVVRDWRKKKEVLQSMPKMQQMMKIEREPQWPELEQRLYDWENPEIPTNKYNINATCTPANFFF